MKQIIAFVLLIFSVQYAFARTPEGAVSSKDTNGDGKVELSEWTKKKGIFKKIDANSDGYLTADEFAAHWTRMGIPFTSEGGNEPDVKEYEDTSEHIKYSVQYPSGNGPHPGLMLLHSSGGFLGSQFYVKFYVDAGYVVYSPDYFNRHGITTRTRETTWTTYKEPIEKELSQLVSVMKNDPKVDANKVFAIGFSNGGYWATYLAGTSQVNAASSHYGVWKSRHGRDCTSYPAYYLNENSSPILALHPKHDSTQDIYCTRYAWKTAEGRGYKKLTPHVYEQQDVTHAWHIDNPSEGYRKNEWVIKDSTERTLNFFKGVLDAQ